MSVLRQMELVEEFAGPDGRLRFATTGRFLERFAIGSIEEFRATVEIGAVEGRDAALIQEWDGA